ncbi:MAG: hypothetical protein ACOX5A_08260 [Aminivibrio sp.]|jgi:hypothetical protein|nr:hypothetical protein [Synergistaceae bacterium]
MTDGKGASLVEYGLIRFGSGEDSLVEDVMTALSRFVPPRPARGYTVEVADSLKGGLSFIEDEKQAGGPSSGALLPLSRVYVSLDDDGGLLLVAADAMEERAGWISRHITSHPGKFFNGVIGASYPGREWTLVGITAPGWMILFDEDLPLAARDHFDDDVKVAYLPAEERAFDYLTPDRTTAEALSFLAEYLLSCLPLREGEDF